MTFWSSYHERLSRGIGLSGASQIRHVLVKFPSLKAETDTSSGNKIIKGYKRDLTSLSEMKRYCKSITTISTNFARAYMLSDRDVWHNRELVRQAIEVVDEQFRAGLDLQQIKVTFTTRATAHTVLHVRDAMEQLGWMVKVPELWQSSWYGAGWWWAWQMRTMLHLDGLMHSAMVVLWREEDEKLWNSRHLGVPSTSHT